MKACQAGRLNSLAADGLRVDGLTAQLCNGVQRLDGSIVRRNGAAARRFNGLMALLALRIYS